MAQKKSYITAALCFSAAGFMLVFCSCLSFDIGDYPSDYVWPHNQPSKNWCGPIGGFMAYYLMYYIGPGIFIVLGTATSGLLVKLAGRQITQPILRSTGFCLLTLAASASTGLILKDTANGFPIGAGGVLGTAVVIFLREHFAILGTAIILVSAWIVGAVLLADVVVVFTARWIGKVFVRVFGLAAPAWYAAREHSQVLGDIWQKLSTKQKQVDSQQTAEFDHEMAEHHDSTIEILAEEAGRKDARPKRAGIKVTSTNTGKGQKPYVPKSYDDYILPSLDLLMEPEHGYTSVQEKVVKAKAASLERLLAEFNVNTKVVAADTGPVITMFELELAAGIKVSQISNLANDMARALGASAVRVVAPLPGKHTIGIEVPNNEKEKVRIKDLIQLAGKKQLQMCIPLFLGKDSSGEALVSDLAVMPHLLIAGTTGSGKSVCINSIITSILLLRRPDEVKLILIDPKMVEMTNFSLIPHLMSPIITEVRRAEQILEWATVKMDERYAIFSEAKVKNIDEYNKLGREEIISRFNPTTEEEEAQIPKKLESIVIIIDELADLMMTSAKEIEAHIVRLAQKSRAVGIHLVLATQRPQATVVTGLIKSNMPTRIGFRVAARMDSRIILDQNGAETLLGQGDMLFLKPGTSELVRAQGTFIDDREVKAIVKYLKEIAEPQFHPELTQLHRIDPSEMHKDELFDEAVRMVLESKRGSVSLLQRRLSIGYARASRIIEMMAAAGILGEYKGSQAREVTMTPEEYQKVRNQMACDAEQGYADLTDEGGTESSENPDPPEKKDAEEGEKIRYEYISNED
ncbi:MAG: DNA translocase FtsK 4TM domain-containing protein [Planctomycetota bacterium]